MLFLGASCLPLLRFGSIERISETLEPVPGINSFGTLFPDTFSTPGAKTPSTDLSIFASTFPDINMTVEPFSVLIITIGSQKKALVQTVTDNPFVLRFGIVSNIVSGTKVSYLLVSFGAI